MVHKGINRILLKSLHENAGKNNANHQKKKKHSSKETQMLRVVVHGEILFGEWSR